MRLKAVYAYNIFIILGWLYYSITFIPLKNTAIKKKMKKQEHYTGLTDAEVLKSRAEHGVNILTPPQKETLWQKFLGKFRDPLISILLVAGALSIGITPYEFF